METVLSSGGDRPVSVTTDEAIALGPGPAVAAGGGVGLARRAWELPLRWHILALAVVLAVCAVVTAPPGRLFVDEGLAILQAQHLAHGHGWAFSWAFHSLDPSGSGFPFPRHSANFVLYGKHPLYPLLLAGLDRIGGVWAMVAFSLAGTVASAGAAASLAGRSRPQLARWALWLVGIGSPLLFDGLVVFAHTAAAAAVTTVMIATLRFEERRRWPWLTVVVLAGGFAVLLRTEAVLLLSAWAVALMIWGVRRRRRGLLWAGLATGVVAVAARLLDQLWGATIGGGGVSLTQAGSRAAGFNLADRVDALVRTLVGPGHDASGGPAPLFLVLGPILLAIAVLLVRGRRRHLARPFALVSLVIAALAGVFVRTPAVPGLLLVFPALVAALGLWPRRWLHSTDEEHRWLAGAVGIFAVAVFATQYSSGGGVEWGARYLAIAMPVVGVLTVDVLSRTARRLDRRLARAGVGVLVASSLILAGTAVTTLRREHVATSRVVGDYLDEAAAVQPGDGGKPVIITDNWALARLAWPRYHSFRWILVHPGGGQRWGNRLGRIGVDRWTVILSSGRVVVH